MVHDSGSRACGSGGRVQSSEFRESLVVGSGFKVCGLVMKKEGDARVSPQPSSLNR